MATTTGSTRSRFQLLYGAAPLHLLTVLVALTVAAYTVGELGLSALWDPDAWWQSIVVWFLGAIVAHDLVLFPLYALADRVTSRVVARSDGEHPRRRLRVSPLNYIRVPVLAIGLLFLIFFPGIVQQGADSYARATGQTQEPFLQRWLLLSAVILALAAVAYAARLVGATRSTRTKGN